MFGACTQTKQAEQKAENAADSNAIVTVDTVAKDKPLLSEGDYAKETTNEQTATKLAGFLRKELADNLKFLKPEERKFSFYEVDLNDDNKPEYFIGFEGSYFCGSGGCSYYLLNNNLSVNTYFTVTRAPIIRSSAITGGWHDLILWGKWKPDTGVESYIHLKYDKAKGKYPSNPSVIKQSDVAPSGHDFVMWDDNFSKAKTFSF